MVFNGPGFILISWDTAVVKEGVIRGDGVDTTGAVVPAGMVWFSGDRAGSGPVQPDKQAAARTIVQQKKLKKFIQGIYPTTVIILCFG